MKKKLLIVVFAFVVMAAAFAQTEADFEVGLTSDSTGVVIKKYTGRVAAVRIPATIQGMPVKEIGDKAFYGQGSPLDGPTNCYAITSVVIPTSVVKIGSAAFQCIIYTGPDARYNPMEFRSKLTSVTLPEGLLEIGNNAFDGCPLTTITLPKSLTKIGDRAFANTNITTLVIPEGITEIERNVFRENSRLTTINFPPSLKVIGQGAFNSC
ncbi:MAG: leucine-rich repeat domain-containing protein, partial [Treponema sp.]|nr:leucine-rich repeat domain-containing protein [Treponema sp.]